MGNNSEEMLDRTVEVWKVAIEAQMHFNELLIRMRTTVISIILGVFGAAAIALRDLALRIQIFGTNVHISVVVLTIGVVFLISHFLIDCFYYFRMLMGAVEFTKKLDENENFKDLFGLTSHISKFVPTGLAWFLLIVYYAVPILLGILCIYFLHFKLLAK